MLREFTNLSQQDDHEHLLRQARSAVAALGRFTAKHSGEREDHERRQRELVEMRERAQTRQNFAQALEALKAEFLSMTSSPSYTASLRYSTSNHAWLTIWSSSRSTVH